MGWKLHAKRYQCMGHQVRGLQSARSHAKCAGPRKVRGPTQSARAHAKCAGCVMSAGAPSARTRAKCVDRGSIARAALSARAAIAWRGEWAALPTHLPRTWHSMPTQCNRGSTRVGRDELQSPGTLRVKWDINQSKNWIPYNHLLIISPFWSNDSWSMTISWPIWWPIWFHCNQMKVFNTLRPRQDGRFFPDDRFKCIFLNENVWIPIDISLKFVPKGSINNIPALVQIMAWRRRGNKPLSEAMMVNLPMHICVSRPQWVKGLRPTQNVLHFKDDISNIFSRIRSAVFSI